MSLTKLSLGGKIPAQGEFSQWHPGWGRENGEPFFTVYESLSTNPATQANVFRVLIRTVHSTVHSFSCICTPWNAFPCDWSKSYGLTWAWLTYIHDLSLGKLMAIISTMHIYSKTLSKFELKMKNSSLLSGSYQPRPTSFRSLWGKDIFSQVQVHSFSGLMDCLSF